MSKGSVGVGTSTIIYTKGRKHRRRTGAVRSDCFKCIHAVVNVDGVANCMVTGDIAVHKSFCEYYKSRYQVERKKTKGKKS